MATKRWLGAAAPVKDLWTITAGGTWAAADTITITINNKSVTATLGATVTVAEVVALAVAMFNSATTPQTDEAYAPTGGGQVINEFKEYLAAAASATTVSLTAVTAGIPGTISVSKSSTSGTFTIAHTTSATGPNFLDDADNWSGNAAPANSDVLVFDAGSTDLLYGLSTSLTGLTIKILDGYSGKIGLPDVHGSGTTAYDEYRTKYLTTAGGTTTVTIDNGALQRCRLAFGANTATIVVRNTGTRPDANIPVVLLTGGDGSSTLALSRGDIGAAFYAGETAQFTTIDMSYVSNRGTDAKFVGGTGLTIATVRKAGGIATFNGNVTTLTQALQGGVTTFMAGTPATATIGGGSLIYNSTSAPAGTAWSVTGDGTIDFDQDPRAKTASNSITLAGATAQIKDRKQVVASFAVVLSHGAKPTQIDRGENYTLTYS